MCILSMSSFNAMLLSSAAVLLLLLLFYIKDLYCQLHATLFAFFFGNFLIGQGLNFSP